MASLALSVLLALSWFAIAVCSSQPHIIFILVDDYGYGDIGYHNREHENLLKTPNLDKFAEGGIKLENYYVQPLCTPTRSTLLSGRYTIHTGLQHSVIHPKAPFGLPTDIPLLPQHLTKLGYLCHKVGKWHVGFYNNASCPWNRGFSKEDGGSDFGFLGGMEDHWTHEKFGFLDFRDNGVPDRADATTVGGDPSKHSTKLYRVRATSIIEDHAANYPAKPLFLYLAFQAVHAPVQVPPHWKTLFNLSDFNNDEDRFIYAAMVRELDFAVGKVVTSLKDNGLYDNSIIVLSSDNGGTRNGGGYNWPLRGQKATTWEGGMRAAAFVHSPLLPTKGFAYRGLLHVSDWLPSFVNMAGGNASAITGLDGHDIWSAISSNGTSPRHEVLHHIDPLVRHTTREAPFGDAAIRVGPLKLLVGSPGKADDHYIPPGCGPKICRPPKMPTAAGCIADTDSTQIWLFDIEKDPRELCNLAEARPKDVARLMSRLVVYNKTAVPARYVGDDPKSDPSIREGIEKNVWGPWLPDKPTPKPTPVLMSLV